MRKVYRIACHCCGDLFFTRSILSKFCSKRCSNKAFRSKATPTQSDLQKLFEQQNEISAADIEQQDVA
ncbi:hypothetical protein ACNFIA_24820 [Pseudomonas sp. NY15437]|uniref:hypothetical protein n=1 Tax=Pseudomonas sp. NY15437 TaxID=3400360 RepID=UPI003A8BCF27